jgi:septum formation protein
MKLILASGSPRRAEILHRAGIVFEVVAAGVDELRLPNETASEYARRLALEKARAASLRADVKGLDGPGIVVGADTVVLSSGEIMGKPASREEAREMLRCLSGKWHEVHTGVALARLPDRTERVAEEITRVEFAKLSDKEIEDYVASGEPNDKAGAYAIQGRGGRFIARIEGCYFNVMGLPLARLYAMLCELGWSPE